MITPHHSYTYVSVLCLMSIVTFWTVQIKSALWVNPRVPEMIGMSELENLAKTYGKFWCTWQVDRGITECNFLFLFSE